MGLPGQRGERGFPGLPGPSVSGSLSFGCTESYGVQRCGGCDALEPISGVASTLVQPGDTVCRWVGVLQSSFFPTRSRWCKA